MSRRWTEGVGRAVSGLVLTREGMMPVFEDGEHRICSREHYELPIGTPTVGQRSQQERAGTSRAASNEMATALTSCQSARDTRPLGHDDTRKRAG
jgi:hypothetical protein